MTFKIVFSEEQFVWALNNAKRVLLEFIESVADDPQHERKYRKVYTALGYIDGILNKLEEHGRG